VIKKKILEGFLPSKTDLLGSINPVKSFLNHRFIASTSELQLLAISVARGHADQDSFLHILNPTPEGWTGRKWHSVSPLGSLRRDCASPGLE
jgi:hypothetical protein